MNKLELETITAAIILIKTMQSPNFLCSGEAERAVNLARLVVSLSYTLPREKWTDAVDEKASQIPAQ